MAQLRRPLERRRGRFLHLDFRLPQPSRLGAAAWPRVGITAVELDRPAGVHHSSGLRGVRSHQACVRSRLQIERPAAVDEHSLSKFVLKVARCKPGEASQ